jgi:hypothetical protein
MSNATLPTDVMRMIYEHVVKLDERASRPADFTYGSGPAYIASVAITKDKIETLTTELNRRFPKGYSVKRDAISEGGFRINMWPGSDYDGKNHSKSIRFSHNSNGGSMHKWPCIKDGDDWTGDETVIFEKGYEIRTFLKAFRGAPCWTMEEIGIFTEAFAMIGIMLKPRQKTALALIERKLVCNEFHGHTRNTNGLQCACSACHRRCKCKNKYRCARDILLRTLDPAPRAWDSLGQLQIR